MKFGIFRIFGNELPPRDTPGQKLRILEFILRKERACPNTEKWWIVNHIFDPVLRKQACELLDLHESKYLFFPFDKKKYDAATTATEKMLAAIPINECRNAALDFGKQKFDYTAILDGDCYFPGTEWKNITNEIEKSRSIYYSLPMIRTTLESEGLLEGPADEPQIVFHKSAEFQFDETLPWGSRDKVELLCRLDHHDMAGTWHTLKKQDICRSVGKVHHLASGPSGYELERDPILRADILWHLREIGFNLYLSRLGSMVLPDFSGRSAIHIL